MKTTLILLILLAATSLLPSWASAEDQSPKADEFVVAIRADQSPRTNLAGWHVKVGEIYQFVRYLSRNEYDGGQLPATEQSYYLLRVGDVTVASNAANFSAVPEKDITTAAIAYGKEVSELRTANASPSIASSPSGGRGLSRNQRRDMLYLLRQQNIISTIDSGESMSDEQIIDLYQKALLNKRLKNIERKLDN